MKARILFIASLTFAAALWVALWTTFNPPPQRPVFAASSFAPIVCDQFKPFSLSANGQLVTAGNANMFVYICSFVFGNSNAAAQPVSIVEGTGSTCATNTLGVIGNTTAAGGLAIPISNTINSGSGTGAIAKTAVAGDNVCLFTGGGPIGGSISWTTAPF